MSESMRDRIEECEQQIGRSFRGNPTAIRQAILTLLSGGHLLIEDVPGIGKTTLALSLARTFDLTFRRIQMTSDLLPADVIGVSVYDPGTSRFEFHPGPVFSEVLLADELNRATPKTQSALLEAMAEGAVSVDGEPRRLPDIYVVLATQNAVEQVGTFPLPESQLDRFLMRISLGYPDREAELDMLSNQRFGQRVDDAPAAMNRADLLAARQQVADVQVHPDIAAYIGEILWATRNHPDVQVGVSPRGGLAMAQVARANAWMDGRDYVIPEDVYDLAVSVLAHRLLPTGADMSGDSMVGTQEALMRRILDGVSSPV